MNREKAEEVLNYFLMSDIDNNRLDGYEDDYEVTFVNDHFAVRHVDTESIHTFKVVFEPSDLPISEWNQAFEDQGWLNTERYDDED